MITLSVLSVIIALTMVLLSYFEEVQQDASETKALIQADIFYADIVAVFKAFEDKKTLFSVLYRMALPLSSDDGRFSLVLQCEPLRKGVNINWLGLKPSGENEVRLSLAQELFESLAQEYNIADAGRLLELIYDEMGGKGKFILKKQSRLHQKKGIIIYSQFEEILSRYQFEVDDSEIGKVPWKQYFSFVPLSNAPKSEKIDVEYSSPELISYIFGIDLLSVKEWSFAIDKQSLETFVNSNGGDYTEKKMLFSGKEFLDESQCAVRYALDGVDYGFRFEYIKGGARYFEFYGKQ
ncbi:MAG: hypothetical protein U9O64_01940 [Campylobacterota bacterium]|nr:hypothetical protein [Campylobacterota bacterium]